ncbi:SDR family oxidoreductase [Rhodococcus sp. X156]|uniref:SDR family oxidoreductase n=1 Tax=Rhodococcus sp. X156 TaxID=2499145 RepID=UPI000FD8B75C|nr:SDR family oxidoreductase [Rhodococcus sp. X156]
MSSAGAGSVTTAGRGTAAERPKPGRSTRRVVSTDGVGLAVHVHEVRDPAGRGTDPDVPTVVCVHGYPDNSSVWDGVVAELRQRYRVVTYDVRGAGDSDKPRGRSAYRMEQLAADLAAVVDAVSPERPVHLLAHDWGSIQTWHSVTGARLAGRIASFTSVSGPSLDHVGAWMRDQLRPSPRALKALARQVLHSTYIGFFQLPLLPELACRAGVLDQMVELDIRRHQSPSGRHVRPHRSTADKINGLQLYRANMGSRIGGPTEQRTDVPVQVLAPSGDSYVTAAMQTEAPAPWVSDLRTRTIAGGHWVVSSRPDVIARCTSELVEHVEHGTQARDLAVAHASALEGRRFAGQLVVVTGGGRGMGRETALTFARQGADVVVADLDDDAAAETVDQARRHGVSAAAYHLDVADGEAFASFAEQVRTEHGVPDVVVNNAGIGMAGPFLATTDADWQRIVDINLWGVIHGSRLFGAQMVQRGQGGRIVNIASAAAYAPSRTYPAYATTKAAVLMLTQCLRAELGPDGVGAVAICPGFIDTDISRSTEHVGLSPAAQEKRREHAVQSYGRRNYTPERAARHIVEATYRNTPVATITAESKVFLAMSRLTPALARQVAKVDLNNL